MDEGPIGIFDSGLGGLTVVKEFLRALPGETIVYFGDTGRVPYGGRSNETISKYAAQDANFLLKQGVKLIVAACGTVSSVASGILEQLPVPYVGVVRPACEHASRATRNGRVGVIGTAATIASGSYRNELRKIAPGIQVFENSCPLFVPLVEGGFIEENDPIVTLTARRYLEEMLAAQVDTLILGCTHYPIIRHVIGNIMGPDVTLISAGHAAATKAAELLCENELLSGAQSGACHFYVSDITQGFSSIASILLGDEKPLDIHLVEEIDTY